MLNNGSYREESSNNVTRDDEIGKLLDKKTESEIWFTSDLHFFKIENPEESDKHFKYIDECIKKANTKIKSTDIFIVCGDICHKDNVGDVFLEPLKNIFKQFPGIKILVRGNHDILNTDFYLDDLGFKYVVDSITWKDLFITHKPKPISEDKLNIHGHIHEDKVVFNMSPKNHVNVWINSHNKYPVNLKSIRNHINKDDGKYEDAKRYNNVSFPYYNDEGKGIFTNDKLGKCELSLEKDPLIDLKQCIKSLSESGTRIEKISELMKLSSKHITTLEEKIMNADMINILKTSLDKDLTEIPDFPIELPFFTPDEMENLGIFNDPFFEPSKEEILNEKIKVKEWYNEYKLLSKGIISESFREYVPLWINKVRELTFKLESDRDNNSLKQSILELGWNPEIPFSKENRKRASIRIKKLVESSSYNKLIDLTPFKSMDIATAITENNTKNETLHPIYIILSYTHSKFENDVLKYSKGKYSHAAISLDSSLKNLYSFNISKVNNRLTKESIDIYLSKDKEENILGVFTIFVNDKELNKIKLNINYFVKNKADFEYGFFNVITLMLNKPVEFNHRMICSQLVNTVIKSSNVESNDLYKLQNDNIYKIYEGITKDYNKSNVDKLIESLIYKVKHINESLQLVNESQYIDYLCENINDINTLLYLDEKSDLLSESTKVVYEEYIHPYIDIYINEAKEFPVQFDTEGNLLIKSIKKIDYRAEYFNSHELLKEYSKANNLEGVKYELSKLWFLNNLLEDKLFRNKKKITKEEQTEYFNVRAKILNDFKKYIKEILNKDEEFNFTEYYNNSPFSDATVKISTSTLKHASSYLKELLSLILKKK